MIKKFFQKKSFPNKHFFLKFQKIIVIFNEKIFLKIFFLFSKLQIKKKYIEKLKTNKKQFFFNELKIEI